MKHNILVKFKKDINYQNMIPDIFTLFNGLKEIDGIHEILIKQNCIDRDNRYHLLIQIDMDKQILSTYDKSDIHKKWKSDYSNYIESKAIFDYE